MGLSSLYSGASSGQVQNLGQHSSGCDTEPLWAVCVKRRGRLGPFPRTRPAVQLGVSEWHSGEKRLLWT